MLSVTPLQMTTEVALPKGDYALAPTPLFKLEEGSALLVDAGSKDSEEIVRIKRVDKLILNGAR